MLRPSSISLPAPRLPVRDRPGGRQASSFCALLLGALCGVLVLVTSAGPASGWAAVRGRVVDASTGRPLAGVELRAEGAASAVRTDAEGRFEIQGLSPGPVTIAVWRTGYGPEKRQVLVPAPAPAGAAPSAEVAATDIVLRLQPIVFYQDSIVVTAARVQRHDSPVPFSNLSKRDLEERYTTQDLPVLLSELPSAIYKSDNGNGIGSSYLTLRGFDQRRVSVLINGVPQNGPEDQQVYWIDFPDLAANLQDVQVQYGAGSGFYGPPAIGGAVNLVTSVFGPRPGIRVQTGGGSFGTQKYSLELNSGLVDSTYALYGRYSRLRSDGYRRGSWVDLTSFFFGAARVDAGMTTRLHVYGGPVADGLSYYGIARADLGDRERRRANVQDTGGQIENFSQPHYELLHEWRLSPRAELFNTLFYVQGDGFYDFDASWADTTYFRLTQEFGFRPTANPGRSLARAFVGNKQGGWLPRFELQHDRGQFTVGSELRVHRSEHWGKVRWAQSLPDMSPDRRYYSYRGGKDVASLYGHERYRLTSRLLATADLQLVHDRYRIYDEAYMGNDFQTRFFFANPRVGLNCAVGPRVHAYASYGYVHREPRLKDLYDATESSGGEAPQFETRPEGGLDFDAPLVRPERLHDVEVGSGYRSSRAAVDLNFYWMVFRDEIVKYGQFKYKPLTGNAARSEHRGLELAGRLQPWTLVEVGGNLSWSRNLLRDFLVYRDADFNKVPTGIQLGGNRIAGYPDFIANLRLTVKPRHVRASLAGRYVGDYFISNFEGADRKVPPYLVLDGDMAYELKAGALPGARLRLQLRNLLDRLYVLHGDMCKDCPVSEEYFPAATRSIFASVEFGL